MQYAYEEQVWIEVQINLHLALTSLPLRLFNQLSNLSLAGQILRNQVEADLHTQHAPRAKQQVSEIPRIFTTFRGKPNEL